MIFNQRLPCALFTCFLMLVFLTGTSKAEVFTLGAWGYACSHDEKDPYGTVIFERKCSASISGDLVWEMGELVVPIFKLTDKRWSLDQEQTLEGCDYTPNEIAVDGVRIDNLSDFEQISAVINGKMLTRRLFEKPWPYCTTHDVTVSLKGSAEVYKKLTILSSKYIRRPAS